MCLNVFLYVSYFKIKLRHLPKRNYAKLPNIIAPSSQAKMRHLPKQNYAKLRNKSSPNCGTKFRQIAEKFQKYLHMSVIFTTFAAFFKK